MNKEISIYFPKAWGEERVLDMFIHQCPHRDGRWGNIIAVDDKSDADYIIVQDNTSEEVDYSKVIYFGREPHYVQGINSRWVNNKCRNFFHHERKNTWMPQTWWLGLDYDTLSDTNVPIKDRGLSIIDSGKGSTQGHKLRSRVVRSLINNFPNQIDVYGKITIGKENRRPYLTTLPYRQKEIGLWRYRYCLAIENGSTDYYFSEKICDPLLCWTMPIYWGCKKISDFFPKGSYYWVDVNKSGVEHEIMEVVNSDFREENIEAIAEARDLVLNKYNLWSSIKKAIDEGKMF